MKAVLKLEWVGMDTDLKMSALGAPMARKPWCAELTGLTRSDFRRIFVRGKADLANSNGVGSRGACLVYILESGRIYEYREYSSWKSSRRRFTAVTPAGDLQHLTREEAEAWLSNPSG